MPIRKKTRNLRRNDGFRHLFHNGSIWTDITYNAIFESCDACVSFLYALLADLDKALFIIDTESDRDRLLPRILCCVQTVKEAACPMHVAAPARSSITVKEKACNATEWKMRESRVLRKLRSGEVALCTKMNLADPRVAEIMAMSGFDCIWTCQEHIGNDYRTIQELILSAKAYDCDILCRVQKGCYSDYILPLEMDASGIMVPHLMSLQEAKQIVNMTRFHPQGRRPLDGGNADGKYCRVPLKEYLEQSNRERFVIFQIEDPEPPRGTRRDRRPGRLRHAVLRTGRFFTFDRRPRQFQQSILAGDTQAHRGNRHQAR